MKKPSKTDPSGTSFISKKFLQELKRRLNTYKRNIREKMFPKTALIFNAYDFPLDPEYLDEFSEWISEQARIDLLQVLPGAGVHTRYERWSDQYILPAYKQGMYNAYAYGGFEAIAGMSASAWVAANFNMPFHISRIGYIYVRAFESLRNMSEATAGAIRAELAQAVLEGVGPREAAKRMVEKIDSIGLHRAELIARTEIMRAHSEANLDVYETFGQQDITLLVEFLYTQDDRVCQKCIDFGTDDDGNPKRFKAEEAHGILPLHPNCRCVWIPWIPALGEINEISETEEDVDF